MEIVKVIKQIFPKLKLVGRKYGNLDRDAFGSFGSKWGEWFQNNYFDPLEHLPNIFGEDNGYVGCMRVHEGQFEYWIGVFTAQEALVPEGYLSINIDENEVGICWVYGTEENGDIYGMEVDKACSDKLTEQGWMVPTCDGHDSTWCFERYVCPRFTTKDQYGKVILDYGIYLQ
jgi:hypothetical protein